MITLGLETSGKLGSVALLHDDKLLGERDLSREGRRHARSLIAEIRDLVNAVSISPAEVDTIAISVGPGSFTGLRVGVACAKTWAYATGAAVVAVETFLAVACQTRAVETCVQVIDDAQRGELFVGTFQHSRGGDWAQVGVIEIVPAAAWIQGITSDTIASGPAVRKLHGQLIGRCRLEADESIDPTARTVASIGQQRAIDGETANLWKLEPVYLRQSAAEEKAQRCC